MLIQKREITLADLGSFIRQMVPGLWQQQHLRLIEFRFQHLKVMPPINSFVRFALNHQGPPGAGWRTFNTRNPARQRTDPGRRQTHRLQRIGLQERQEVGIVGVLAETAGNAASRWARFIDGARG